jgi:hypothetical protein
MRGLGIEEGEGFGGSSDAAGDEQLGENEGQTGFAGEGSGFFRVQFVEDPALTRRRTLRRYGLRRWGPIAGAGRAHALYSSSSSCECVSSITMS